MRSQELIEKLLSIEKNYKTLYVLGAIGAPLNESTAKRYKSWYSYNAKSERAKMIDNAVRDGNVFGFDCVCLVKAVAWGWCGDKKHNYGGCKIDYNIVKDIDTEGMRDVCLDLSDDFDNIIPGEYLWMQGHCGVYIGDGLAIECTPKWANCVQITAVGNIGKKDGYNTRTWIKHGKLPFVEYTVEITPKPEEDNPPDINAGSKPIDIDNNLNDESNETDIVKDGTIEKTDDILEKTDDTSQAVDNTPKESKTKIFTSILEFIFKIIKLFGGVK